MADLVTVVTREEIKELLMSPKEKGIKTPYFTFRGENGENITFLNAGKNGNEFNKTYGKINTFPGVELFRCVYGQGLLIMQRNDEEGEAKEFRIISLRGRVSGEIPSGYGHALINTGKNFLIVVDNAPADKKNFDTESITNKKGFAYYIVDKQGDISVEKNPNYHFYPEIASQ